VGSIRRSAAGLAALTMLFAACSTNSSTLAPLIVPTATPVLTPGSAAPVVQAPSAPTAFTATRKTGSVPCPSAGAAGTSCSQTDFVWQSAAASGTTFKIYNAWTGEGPSTCTDVQSEAVAILTPAAGATTAQFFAEIATGGGQACYWITALNAAGESAQVPATSNSPGSAVQAPPEPTNFTATLKPGSVACPSPAPNGGGSCSQTDLAWQSTAAPGTMFDIYRASTGEGGATCTDAQPDEELIMTTPADATTAQFFAEIATGGGQACYWITAINNDGESAQVAAAGQ
jgi:hypothetical protein